MTYLTKNLIDKVDDGLISIGMAVEMSYLSKKYQEWIYDYISQIGMVSMEQIMELRNYREDNSLTREQLYELLSESKAVREKRKSRLIISENDLNRFFPPEYTNAQIAKVIKELLEQWKKERESGEDAV